MPWALGIWAGLGGSLGFLILVTVGSFCLG
jgi:hypothetical protein